MGKDFNDKFRDYIDKINNIAKSKGWKNGKDWAAFAVKFHLISESMKVDYDNCHVLRNSMSHGNAKNIVVHQATYSTAKTFLKIIEAKIRENKGNKKTQKFGNAINHGKANKIRIDSGAAKIVFSSTENEYLKDLLGSISIVYADVAYDISNLASTLRDSDEPICKSSKLLYALKDRLYSHGTDVAKEYYDILNVFLP